jgi:tetratricopeptide (TPR) repeat protein
VDLTTFFRDTKTGSVYALLRVYSPREQPIAALIGSSGPLRFWLNGRLLHELGRPPSPQADDEGVPITVRAGWNTLLFKVELGKGLNHLCLWLSDKPADRVRALADRGQWDQATALVTESLKRQPNQPAVLLSAARFYRQHADDLRRQGRKDQGEQIEQQARACFEKLLVLQPDHDGYAAEFADYLLSWPDHWEILEPVAMKSAGGTTLTKRHDGAILASGKKPWPETYTITSKTRLTGITAIRLELLTDPSLPGGGPGRAGNGNIRLAEFRLTAAPEANPTKASPVLMHRAWADYSEYGLPVAAAIDGNDGTAWAIHPYGGQPHVALFEVKEPIVHASGTILTFTLDQRPRPAEPHSLGCFRLSVATQPKALWLEKVRSIATHAASSWTKLAAVHYLRGEDQAALAVLRKVIDSPSGGSGSDRLLLCLVHDHLGHHEEAEKWCDDAIAWLTKNPAAQPPEFLILEAVSKRIQQQPGNAQLWLLRSRGYAGQGSWAEATSDLNHALELNPALELGAQDAPMLGRRARALLAKGHHAAAAADYTTLIRWSPGDFLLYERRAKCYDALKEPAKAQADRDKAVALPSATALSLNNLAWQMVTGPVELRDPARGLKLVQLALQKEPNNSHYVNTLGVAQYRNGLYQEAIVTLERSLALSNGGSDAYDLFFLAMCHARLKESKKAHECIDRAVAWIKGRTSLDATWPDELRQFQAEAEAVLKEK